MKYAGGSPDICAPMVGGSGAIVVHRALEAGLSGYRVIELSPYRALCPPLLVLRNRPACTITHSIPELGAHIAHPDSVLVTTFHNYYLDEAALAGASLQQRWYYRNVMGPAVASALKRARRVTAVSDFTADLVGRHHPVGDRLVVVRNGVDTERFSPGQPAADGTIRILFAGNPTRRKGAEHLAALAQALPDHACLQYTAGLRHSMTNPPAESEKLVALPPRDHAGMPALYRQADILFFPTRREGLSLVALEAMACGLPVVATRCSSMPELVDHGKGGFLFDLDDREQMLGYLVRLVSDPVLRAEMGAYNREKVLAGFTLDRMLEGYRQVFADCAG